MKKNTLAKLMRITAVLIFVIGAFLGYDAGSRQLVAGSEIIETFDLWSALLIWFGAFALGLLFLSIAKILDSLKQ